MWLPANAGMSLLAICAVLLALAHLALSLPYPIDRTGIYFLVLAPLALYLTLADDGDGTEEWLRGVNWSRTAATAVRMASARSAPLAIRAATRCLAIANGGRTRTEATSRTAPTVDVPG